jgi:hypothetical protein
MSGSIRRDGAERHLTYGTSNEVESAYFGTRLPTQCLPPVYRLHSRKLLFTD